MKQCPKCHFTFADFHGVCAFDGAELVPYERPQSVMTAAPLPTQRRLSLKPSMSLTSLAVLVVFLSAVLIGYLKSPNPSIPALIVQERDADSASSTPRTGKLEEESTSGSQVAARRTPVRNMKRRLPASRVTPEMKRAGHRPPNTTIARQLEVEQTSRDKSPKVVAILKTTWRVLKKPFEF